MSTTQERARVSTAPRYKWVALSNTTLGVFMAVLDGSIVIIALLLGGLSVLAS